MASDGTSSGCRVSDGGDDVTESESISVHVNLLWCAHGRVGGSEEYLVRQLAGLSQLDQPGASPSIRCTLHLGRPLAAARSELASHTQIIASLNVDRRSTRMVVEHSRLALDTRKADLVHHGGGTIPLIRPSAPTVLTIHDLQYLRFPQYFSAARLRYLQAMMPRSARTATMIATPTAHVADDVAAAFSVDRSKIVVVPHGVPTLVADDAEIGRQRGLVGTYGALIVYPAITHPHKGHVRLIEAMQYLPEARLVLIGGVGADEDDVQRAISASRNPDQILRLGRVPDGVRNALIAAADVVAIPSEEEGFGAPVIEAMTLGTPVVCSDIGALREVAGSAAVFIGRDPDAIANGVREALQRTAELSDAGRKQSANFTLAASGAALRDAYLQAVNRA